MRTEQTLILERTELKQHAIGKDINLISFIDFKISDQLFLTHTIILFIDNNGETRILKNRFGDKGVPSITNILKPFFKNKAKEHNINECCLTIENMGTHLSLCASTEFGSFVLEQSINF
jgi:hypothetical protein